MHLLDAIDDPLLLGATTQGDVWHPWKVAFAAMDGLPITRAPAGAWELFTSCTGRSRWPTKRARRFWGICGRRGMKTAAMARVLVRDAFFGDWKLAPGEQGVAMLMAPTKAQSQVALGYVRAAIAASPLLSAQVVREVADGLELANKVTIEVTAYSYKSPRGKTIVCFGGDESNFWMDDTSAAPDLEVLRAVAPSVDACGGRMVLISSPYSKRGQTFEAYRQFWGVDDDDVLVWTASSKVMNPALDDAMIAKAYADDPEAAQSEFGGEFRSDLASYVDVATLDACTVQGRQVLEPVPGITYAAFTDVAGGSGRDAMTLAIGHRDGDVAVLDKVVWLDPPFNPTVALDTFIPVLRNYRVLAVYGDRFAGTWAQAPFERCGVQYKIAPWPKSDAYRDFLPALNGRKVELLDVPRLRTEFARLERKTGRSGRDVIDHMPSARDDVANSVAGCLLLTARKSVPFGFMFIDGI